MPRKASNKLERDGTHPPTDRKSGNNGNGKENLKVRTCSICFHAKRIEIEKTYEDPKSWRKALQKFKISQGAYYRHRLHYVVNEVELEDLIGFEDDEKFSEIDELWKTYCLITHILWKMMSLPMTEGTLNMTARFLALRLRILEGRIHAFSTGFDDSNWPEDEEEDPNEKLRLEVFDKLRPEIKQQLLEKWKREIEDKLNQRKVGPECPEA